MERWFAVSKIGKYAQGDITSEMFAEMVATYDKEFQQAPFIPEHRSFNDKGEMINNHRALAWINEIMTDGTYLFVRVEDKNDLDWVYDGLSFKYASIEIEVVKKTDNAEPILYLAAVAVTNFPAAHIPAIALGSIKSFTEKKTGNLLYAAYNKIETKDNTNLNEEAMNKEQFIKLCKALDLPETSKPEDVITKLTEMKTAMQSNEEMKKYSSQFDGIVALLSEMKVEEQPKPSGSDDAITKLTNTVNTLVSKFDSITNRDLESEVDKAVADQKILPSMKDDYLKKYSNDVDGFKALVAKMPKIQMSATFTAPKKEDGNILTYNDLLADPKKYSEMQKDNPELLKQLRNDWIANPSAKSEKEDK